MSELAKQLTPGKPGTLETVLNGKELEKEKEENLRTSLFSFNYKFGNVTRSEVIRARDQADAELQVTRFLKFKSYGSFNKYVLMGKITPFAIDVDREIKIFNERCEREGTSPYTEASAAARVQPKIQG